MKLKYRRASDCIWSGLVDDGLWLKDGTDDSWIKPWFGDSLISILKNEYKLK